MRISSDVGKEEIPKIVGHYLGKSRSEKSKALIEECLASWDLNDGMITNQRIAEITQLCVNTFSNHKKTFKPIKDNLNKAIKEKG